MDKLSLKTLWLCVMLGMLMSTSRFWLHQSASSASHYDAPWMPGYSISTH
jgi:hypothetical protein